MVRLTLNKSSRAGGSKQEIFQRINTLEQRIMELESEIQEQKKLKTELESRIERLSLNSVEELRGSVYRLGRVVARMRSSL